MKIRIRAILVIVLTNALIIVLSIMAGIGYVGGNIDRYIEADMLVVADIADRFISSELELLRISAAKIANDFIEAKYIEAEYIESQYTKFIGRAIMNRDAQVSGVTGERAAAPELFEDEAIQRAFSGETAFTSTVRTDDGMAIYLATPLFGAPVSDPLSDRAYETAPVSASAPVDRVLILTLDGMFLSDLVSEYHVWETGHIFIDDSDGYVIANIRPEWVEDRQNFVIQAQSDPQYDEVASVVERLVKGERGIGYYSMNGITRICAFRPIGGSEEGWSLGIVAPVSESPALNVNRGLLLIAAVSILLNFAAAIVASNFIKRPFEEVAAHKERAEEALADARRANNAKSDFLAHMSHEIRTPLNAVIGLSELTLGERLPDGVAESNLEKINAAGATILSIVNDILDISKIESGKLETYPVRYDTPSLVNDVVALNIVRIGERPVSFKLSLDENLPGELFGDDLRVKQVFNNLLSNAFKYTNAGTVEWRVTYERDGDDVWLISDVRDTGIGMTPESISRLFTEYNQVDTGTNRKVEGTGLGLAIVKRLTQIMDGSITVESEYGKGSVFRVRLRQKFVSKTPIGREVAQNLMRMRYTISKRDKNARLSRTDLSYARVLVVDDIATNLDVMKGMLKPYGVMIDCALGGARAVEMIRAETVRYGAVFMDHMMPDMDGIEATRIIREEIGTDYARNIPIIALTANAIVGNEEMFLANGFSDFISKPIDLQKLDAVLRRWVRDKALEKGSKIAPAVNGLPRVSATSRGGAGGGGAAGNVSVGGGASGGGAGGGLAGGGAGGAANNAGGNDAIIGSASDRDADYGFAYNPNGKSAAASAGGDTERGGDIEEDDDIEEGGDIEEDGGLKQGASSVLDGITIEGADIIKALERFSGDEAVLIEVLRSYAANTPPLLARLKENLETKNLAAFAVVVHGIKGSSYGIFAQEVGRVAGEMEMLSKDGRLTEVESGRVALDGLVNKLIDNINEALAEIDRVNPKQIAKEPDARLLGELREACSAFSMDRVDAAMAALESFRYEKGEELVAWLRGRVDSMSLEEIAAGEWLRPS